MVENKYKLRGILCYKIGCEIVKNIKNEIWKGKRRLGGLYIFKCEKFSIIFKN